MKKVALLIDSSSGIKKEMLKQYEDTYLLPLLLNFPDGTEIEDDDDVISYDEFYDILEHQVIKTSQIPLGKMMTTWNELLKTYEKIVFVGLSKGLSGQHDSTYMLSQQDEYKDRVFVIDTDGVSLIIRKMIDDIYQWIKSGINVTEIQAKIDELKQHFTAFIIPKSLETLKRGGRITPAAAALAKVLKITPILRYDGKIDKFDKTRTFKKAVETALTQIKKERKSRKIDLVYSKMNDELLEEVKNITKEKGFEINQLANLPNVIAAHTGANTIALICWDK
ncbi:DegV family protein [Spiroplasma chrysopicola]|uniref:DegV family protein n=1 Tax=Spiroplasma chrysopicola DF-1 TaxID=1276227 RepID=R4UC01_9MOLU|nr:DegV family protein [Spiroplasma chrysopicola]AGM25444.1 DegV family protein [Spiroplasma chrysopicola DF-1]